MEEKGASVVEEVKNKKKNWKKGKEEGEEEEMKRRRGCVVLDEVWCTRSTVLSVNRRSSSTRRR